MKNILLLSLLLGLTELANTTEVDNFSHRDISTDSREWLNKKMNESLDAAIAKRTNKGCNQFEVQRRLFVDLGGFLYANIEKWSETNPGTFRLPIEKSIYKGVMDVTGHYGWRTQVKFSKYYTPDLFRVGNTILGDDKLEHFFQLGYAMYHAAKLKENPKFPDIRKLSQKGGNALAGDTGYIKITNLKGDALVHAFSKFQEDGEWGLRGPLVRSYGDIAANWEGYQFWLNLTEGNNPFLKCEERKWKRVRDFDWATYVNDSWDEAINCSDFDKSIEGPINEAIKALGLDQCPIKKDSCAQLVKHYGEAAQHLLHPRCFQQK